MHASTPAPQALAHPSTSAPAAIGITAYLLSDEVAAFSRRLPTIVRDVRGAVQSACVPYAGPAVLGASALAALVQFKSLSMVALVSGVSLGITGLEGFLLAPMMLGQAAKVNAVAVFVAVMFWGWLWRRGTDCGPGPDECEDHCRQRGVACGPQRTALRLGREGGARPLHVSRQGKHDSGEAIAKNIGGANMYLRLIPTILASFLSVVAIAAQDQDRATVQLRDGTKVEGRIEALGQGTLFLRVSLADQRRIPVSSIALIDRKGGASGLPETEVREARNAEQLLLLTNGSSVKGQLVQIRGGEGSGDEGPRTYIFRSTAGEDRNYSSDQISRIYLGSYPFEATVRQASAPEAQPYVPAGGVRVPAASSWVATGITVRRGDLVSFDTTGEVQLSENPADRATSAGTNRTARSAPMAEVNAGALIGRIGGNGQPFGIGDQASVPMPGAGMLYLAVNDDERSDNAGEFIVVLNRRR